MSLLHLTANRLKRALHIRKSIEALTQEFVDLVKGTDLPKPRRQPAKAAKAASAPNKAKKPASKVSKTAKPKKPAVSRAKKASAKSS